MTRTLQELIAPDYVQFYDKDWIYHGSRTEVARELAQVTYIDLRLLNSSRDENLARNSGRVKAREILGDYSIANRMSWAAKRETTRPEDIAYCLFGMFDVHLPPLYGEGADKAFLRLQEEIIKTSTDLSILAWSSKNLPQSPGPMYRVLAPSPAWFSNRTNICVEDPRSNGVEPFRVTNKGLRVKLPVIRSKSLRKCTVILPNCFYAGRPDRLIGIRLVSWNRTTSILAEGRSVWYRDSPDLEIMTVHRKDVRDDIFKLYMVMTGPYYKWTLFPAR
jgi:hypothetical protein